MKSTDIRLVIIKFNWIVWEHSFKSSQKSWRSLAELMLVLKYLTAHNVKRSILLWPKDKNVSYTFLRVKNKTIKRQIRQKQLVHFLSAITVERKREAIFSHTKLESIL